MIKQVLKKASLTLAGALVATSVQGSGMLTHLNMSKDAIDLHTPDGDLKHILTTYRRHVLTGTVYPDFDHSVKVLPWRKSQGTFGQTHGIRFHEAYFDHLRDTYDVATCVSRNDEACMAAVAMYLGIIAHSAQDAIWDMMFVRQGFIMDYQTDDIWVGDLDTGGDVLMWDEGKGMSFSYTAPYNDLIDVYADLGQTVSENYIGDGLRTHNVALEFENEFFALQGKSAEYRSHAPWFMNNAHNHPMGIPLYGKLTAGVMQQAWSALISENGSGAVASPIVYQWPEDGATHPADAYVTLVVGRNMSGGRISLHDENGDEVEIGGLRGGGFIYTLFPKKDLKVGHRYTVRINNGFKYHKGGNNPFPDGYVTEFLVGESTKRWKTGNLFIDRNSSNIPLERPDGPKYFSLVDERENLCVEIKDGIVATGAASVLIANQCDGSDKQKFYLLASEQDGHTRGTRLVSKLDDAYCIDLPGGNQTPGTQLRMAKCTKFANSMYWALNGDNTPGNQNTVTSKLNNNMGFDVYGMGAGTKIAISQIHGGPNQRFIRRYDNDVANERFALRDMNSGKCMAPEGNRGNGTANVRLVPCENNKYYQWWMSEAGRLHYAADFLGCLHVENENNGTNVELRQCIRGNDNRQKWTLQGQSLMNFIHTGRVVEVADANTQDNANIRIWDKVSGADNQRWEKVSGNGQVINNPPESQVCFYENDNFSGRELCLGEGNYAELANRWGDVFSGVKFDNGRDLYVEAYEHNDFTGTRYQLMENVAAMGAFKDRFSSIVIKRRPHNNYACMFEHPNYGGSGLCAFAGAQDGALHNEHFNDKISSVLVSGHAWITLYSNDNFTGGTYTATRSMPSIVGSDMNDAASSYQVNTEGGPWAEVMNRKLVAGWDVNVCLNIDGDRSTQNGTNANIHNCGQVSESWHLLPDGKLQAAWNTAYCLDVAGTNSGSNGANVGLWQCDQVTEGWDLGSDGKLRARWNSSMCLDVNGKNSRDNGSNAQLWQCDRVSERWAFK